MNAPAPARSAAAHDPVRRIAILCATAEPGRDGVGDYAARVAAVLADRGLGVCLIAVRDGQLAGTTPARDVRDGVETLRLPASAGDPQRAEWLDGALRAFRPDCLYLQVVCWGFAPRGILRPLPTALASVLARHRVIVNAHELWLGLEHGASLKHRLWGRLQRGALLKFFAAFRPVRIVTSTPGYAMVLRRHRWEASLLPIPSNILVAGDDARGVWAAISSGLAAAPGPRSDYLVAVTFATVVPEWEPVEALVWLSAQAALRGQRLLLVAVGRTHEAGLRRLETLRQTLGRTATVVALGERPAAFISALLREADVGLPSTPPTFIAKSGAAAAMRVHGLPVLLIDQGIRLRGVEPAGQAPWAGCVLFDPARPPDVDALLAAKRPPRDDLGEIVDQLLVLANEAVRA